MSIYSWHLLQRTPGAFCLWYLMTPFFLDWNPQEFSPTLDNNDIGLWLCNNVLFIIYALRMYGTFILHHQWYSEFPLLTPMFRLSILCVAGSWILRDLWTDSPFVGGTVSTLLMQFFAVYFIFIWNFTWICFYILSFP